MPADSGVQNDFKLSRDFVHNLPEFVTIARRSAKLCGRKH